MGFFGKGFLSRSKPEYEVISNISQKAFSKSEKLRRLRPKEREIRQSKFRVIRKERFKNHKQWWEQATGECLEDDPVIAENVEENSVTECLQHEKETTCDSETMQENPLVEEDKNPLPKRIKMDIALSNDELLLNQPEFHPDVSHDEEIRMHSSDDEDISNSNSEDDIEASIANKQMEEVIRDVVRNSNQCKPDKVSEETIQTKPKSNGLRQDDPYKVYEHLQLSLEEAFFLSYGLGCLSVLNNNKEPMSLSEMWSSFCAAKQNFIPSYITYHYFRSKGWVPKIGIKYGADLVLYKEGMPFYHSSYSVIVQMIDSQSLEDKKNNTSDPCRQLTWPQLCGVSRVSGHAAKEVMRCYVIKPSDMTNEEMSSPKCISRFKLQEVVLRRWIPERAREPDKDKTMKRMRTRSMNME